MALVRPLRPFRSLRLAAPSPRIRRSTRLLALAVTLAVALAAAAPAQDWPSFRGQHARGVVSGQDLPQSWNVETGDNVRWRAELPGLAHSSPIVWKDRIFVATVVSSRGDADFQQGLYGEGTASDDRTPQQWWVYAFDAETGEVAWRTKVHEGVPKEKRHIKATYANQTLATDGEILAAFFGSEGLFGLGLDGEVRWRHQVGFLDVGAYDAPTYEWGSASSPIVWDGKVIVQCDTQGEDFLLAVDAGTGEEVWRTERDELPSWGTPTVVPGPPRDELVTNGANLIRGYDPATGKELWRLGGSSPITAPTPIFDGDLIVVASGRRPNKPIFVLRRGAEGDITLADGERSNEHVVWSLEGRGPYMPTPIIVGDNLYVLENQGVLSAFELATGEERYRVRLGHGGSGFSASPVAADGVIYLPSEDGEVFVVRAGDEFEELAKVSLGERVMATPAISGGALFFRTDRSLIAVGRPAAASGGG